MAGFFWEAGLNLDPEGIDLVHVVHSQDSTSARPRIQLSSAPGPGPVNRRCWNPTYSSRRNRRYLRRRQIRHTIPEPKDQWANRQRRGSKGGRPTGFDGEVYKRRNEVERTINPAEELPSRRHPLR